MMLRITKAEGHLMLFVAMPLTKHQRAMLGDENMFHNALHKYPVDFFYLSFHIFPSMHAAEVIIVVI